MTRRLGLLAAAAALAVAGCSSDDLTERIAEEAAEQAAGGEVDIDTSGDGSVSIEGSEGSMSFGTGGELAASFPDDLPLPEGYEVVNTFEQDADTDGMRLQTSLQTAASVDDLATRFEEELTDAGWEIRDQRTSEMEDLQSVTFAVENAEHGAIITITSDGQDATLVNYGIGEPSS